MLKIKQSIIAAENLVNLRTFNTSAQIRAGTANVNRAHPPDYLARNLM